MNLKVLIVEDDPHIIFLMCEHLKDHGVTDVTEVMTAAGASLMLRERQFDLVLLDLKLANGLAWPILEGHRRITDPAIVVLSGTANPEDARRARRGDNIMFRGKVGAWESIPSFLAHARRVADDGERRRSIPSRHRRRHDDPQPNEGDPS